MPWDFGEGYFAHYNMDIPMGGLSKERWKINNRRGSAREISLQNTMWAAGVWALWKERNSRVFSEKRRPVHVLINDTTVHLSLWDQGG